MAQLLKLTAKGSAATTVFAHALEKFQAIEVALASANDFQSHYFLRQST
jgi:hypothetical protein